MDDRRFVECNSNTVAAIKERIYRISNFLDIYKWIADAYISDFYVSDFWSRLPVTWTTYLSELSPPHISFLLRKDVHTYSQVPPLSLLAYRECVLSLSLDREPVDLEENQQVESLLHALSGVELNGVFEHREDRIKEKLEKPKHGKNHSKKKTEEKINNGPDVNTEYSSRLETENEVQDTGTGEKGCLQHLKENTGVKNFVPEAPASESSQNHEIKHPENACESNGEETGIANEESCRKMSERPEWRGVMKNGQWMELEHVYRKHVKPKKQHEIQKLSQTISYMCHHCECSQVVDVGAGLGHLSRILTFGHGVKVTTVEASGGHAPKASKYDRETKRDMKKVKLKKMKKSGQCPSNKDNIVPEDVDPAQLVLPSHISCMIHPNMADKQFLDIIKQSRRHQSEADMQEVKGQGGHVGFSDAQKGDDILQKSEAVNQNSEQTVKEQDGTLQDISVKRKGEQGGLQEITADNQNSNENQIVSNNGCFKETKEDISAVNKKQTSSNTQNGAHCQKSENGNFENQTSYDTLDQNKNCKFSQTQMLNQTTHMNENIPTNGQDSQDDERLVLAGLHACGDLTPTLIRLFVNCRAVVGLASVGCCYMKMSAESLSEEQGYPMSVFVSQFKESHLTYSSRELACHFADAYIQRLQDNPPHLKIHSYRAALQHLIYHLLPNHTHGAIKLTVKDATNKTFESYAKTALHKLGYTADIPAKLLTEAESYLPLWKIVVIFYTLRLCLAPVIETLILLDRMVFLYEHDIDSILAPIFDPKLSPRNFVLLASKSKHQPT